MDSKKVMLILAVLAMVLLISSEVSARDLTETSTDTKKEVVEQKFPTIHNPFHPKPIKGEPLPPYRVPPRHPPHYCGQNQHCCGRKNTPFYCAKCCSNGGDAVEGNTHN